ncbi:unnamed protein product [Ectocarpus sp. CCAP 1310/34]|nr:unnamed protein product [Ectocarpus sp. CCAP 1310/34]
MEWGTFGGGSSNRASLVRPRSRAERQLLEDEDVAAVADHMDQADSEFVAKMCIASAFLSCLLAWLAWSFWWDRNGRKLAGGRRGPRVQPRPPLPTTRSFDSLSDSANSPSNGVGVADGCHRGALATDRSQPRQQQQRDEGQNRGQRQDGINEFYNPLWVQRGASRCCAEAIAADGHPVFQGEPASPNGGIEWDSRAGAASTCPKADSSKVPGAALRKMQQQQGAPCNDTVKKRTDPRLSADGFSPEGDLCRDDWWEGKRRGGDSDSPEREAEWV